MYLTKLYTIECRKYKLNLHIKRLKNIFVLQSVSEKIVVKQNERIKSEVNKLVKEVVKSCETKISKLNLELNKADQSLKDTEAFYEKDETLQQHFQDKISSIKSKKEKLEEEIF